MSFWKEFKQFITRGNVIDLAVAVVIGAAFNKIVNSFVNDILMPPIGMALNGIDFSRLQVVIKKGPPAVAIHYGAFINTIISFLIIAFSVFLVIKLVAKLYKKKEAPVTTKDCPECCMTIPLAAKKCGHCGSLLKEGN